MEGHAFQDGDHLVDGLAGSAVRPFKSKIRVPAPRRARISFVVPTAAAYG
jgi:hypothetical protein